ncbi:MAG: prephenate dehydrogenase [Planctomycetota bacterium]|nr:prephenate dehydrogenase [Planctomycetota bacterium]
MGVGLIGGSVGLALRARGLADRVVGVGRDPARLALAKKLGAIDDIAPDLVRGVVQADVAVVCTPVSQIAEECLRIAAAGPEGLLITDAGSTKSAIVRAVEADPRARSMFCAAHPIAGSERHGVASARADLFEGRAVVLTPTDRTPSDRLRRATAFWRALDAQVLTMRPDRHDAALALTSHLPHAVASALAGAIPVEMLPLAGGAYRDVTRVAASDPSLWTEIFLANRGSMVAALAAFRSRLEMFSRLLAEGDSAGLVAWWNEAKAIRDQFSFDPPGSDDPRQAPGPSR